MNGGTLVLFALGLLLLVSGAEALVSGLAVVAYGTSTPELAVSVQSGLSGQADIALGNVVGSNIFNVLFILGVSATITPLVVAQQLVRLEVPLMIGVSLLLAILARDGGIDRLDGIALFAGIATYTFFTIRQSRKESRQIKEEYAKEFGAGPPQAGGRVALHVALIVLGLAAL